MYLNVWCHMAALGIQSIFLPTTYGGASIEWVKLLNLTIYNIFFLHFLLQKIPVRATDQRTPERTDNSEVTVTIRRNQFTVQFTDEPYQVTVQDKRAVGDVIYTVSAFDQDLLVSYLFKHERLLSI